MYYLCPLVINCGKSYSSNLLASYLPANSFKYTSSMG
jgi:hypothetical protein